MSILLSNSNPLMDNGYDKKFNIYNKHICDIASTALLQFIIDNVNKYFECDTVSGRRSSACFEAEILILAE